MNTALVWVLIVSSNMVEQLGYYATQQDCAVVQQSDPIKHFASQCIQVRIVFNGKGNFRE